VIKRLYLAVALLMMSVLLLPFSAFAMGFDAETVYDSVVVVYSGNSIGSGFAVGEHCIITNAHVIEDTSAVMVRTYSGDNYRASVDSINTKLDIAVLAVSGVSFIAFKPADIDTVKVGDEVYTIGAPNNMAYTLTKGILSAKDRKISGQSYLQTDAAINTGNSGGPLLNSVGEVVGVNTMKMSDTEGIGLAIPITTVYSFLDGEGIPIDDNGRVNVETTPENSSTTDNKPTAVKPDESRSILVIFILLGCSVALNMVLIIVIIYSRNKSRYRKPDPSERTDFDIDILG